MPQLALFPDPEPDLLLVTDRGIDRFILRRSGDGWLATDLAGAVLVSCSRSQGATTQIAMAELERRELRAAVKGAA